MDPLTVGEMLATAPLLAVCLVLVGIALVTRKAVLASVGRIGARVGRLEQGRIADQHAAELERTRRWQLEAVLIGAGHQLPPWPDLTDVVPAPIPRHSLPDWSPHR